MYNGKNSLFRKLFRKTKSYFAKKSRLFAIIFTIIVLVIVPSANRLLAQKVIPSVQTKNNKFETDKEEVQKNNGQIPTSTYPATTQINNGGGWRNFSYEQLVNYTPTPQDSGEYITFLIQRSAERLEEIRTMDLTAEQKSLVAKNIQKNTSKQLSVVRKNLDNYLKALANSV